MLDLPVGYSFDDFRECHYFAHEMIMDKSRAEQNDPMPTIYVGCEYDPETASEYERHEAEHGPNVAYFYRLQKHYPSMSARASAFEDVIIECDGNSSDIAEVYYLDGFTTPPKRNVEIAATAHSLVFKMLSGLFDSMVFLCPTDEKRNSSISLIESKIDELKATSASFQYEDESDELRIISRLKREFAIVAGRHSNTISLKMVTIAQVKHIIEKERGRTYTLPFMSKYTKEWPEPDIPKSGSRPGEWKFERLIPTLKNQFTDINWSKY